MRTPAAIAGSTTSDDGIMVAPMTRTELKSLLNRAPVYISIVMMVGAIVAAWFVGGPGTKAFLGGSAFISFVSWSIIREAERRDREKEEQEL